MNLATIILLIGVACLGASAQTALQPPRPVAQDRPHSHVTQGKLIEHSNPGYPSEARAHGISGSVLFRAHILADGTVGHLTVLSGPPELQEASEKAIYLWRYSPWMVNDQPVDMHISIPVNFNLNQPNGAAVPPKPTGQKISALDLQGLLVRSYPAKRSRESERANIFGTVTLHVIIDATGRIADLGVLHGPEELEDAALETVRHWIYQPYLSNGQFIAVDSTIDIRF